LGNGQALISTTDFFMPVVDDPFDFGRIAATNAISDVYAMGGNPVLAIAILGWPIDKLSPAVASRVIAGGRKACLDAGIPLAGGHSIDSPEPIFGLAVNGLVPTESIKRNDSAKQGDWLFLTKSIGIGMITTASKKNLLETADLSKAVESMTKLNLLGVKLGSINGINAMTDVTGFGLAGHLIEMAEGSGLTALVDFTKIPVMPSAMKYLELGCVPGGTNRNWKSYGQKVDDVNETQRLILADPQTSGGLLVSVSESSVPEVISLFQEFGLEEQYCAPIGRMVENNGRSLTLGLG
ncbi:MAG: selenide, water dikinase SelD, partial [Bacteroidota bacterium]